MASEALIVDLGHFAVKFGVAQSIGKTTQKGILNNSIATPTGLYDTTGAISSDVFRSALDQILSGIERFNVANGSIVVLTDVLVGSRNRELMLQVIFESLGFKRAFMGYSATAALISAGRDSGMVLEVGHSGSRLIPVLEAQPVRQFVSVSENGGGYQSELTRHLLRRSGDVGNDLLTDEVVHKFKSSYLRLRENASSEAEQAVTENVALILPDGEKITFDTNEADLAAAGNALFEYRPPADGALNPAVGISELIIASARPLANKYPRIGGHWLAYGGPTNMRGVMNRLDDQVGKLYLSNGEILQRSSTQDAVYAPIIGGRTFAQLPGFGDRCVTKERYGEEGPARCLQRSAADGHHL